MLVWRRFLFLKGLHCLNGTLLARKSLTKFVLVQVSLLFSTPYKNVLSMLYIMGMLEGTEAVRMKHGDGCHPVREITPLLFIGPNAISVSLSPMGRYVMVGLASRRILLHPSTEHMVAQVFRLQQPHGGETSMRVSVCFCVTLALA